MSVMRLIGEVIDLDHRLFTRWLRGFGSEAALPAVIGTMVLAAQFDSAIQAGVIAQHTSRGFVDALVDLYAAGSYLAAAMLGIVLGEVALARRVDGWLALSGVPRAHRFLSIQLLAIGARHLIVVSISVLPAAALLWTVGGPVRAAAAIAGLVALLLTASSFGRVIARGAERISTAWLILVAAIAIGALVGVQDTRAPLFAWLPTHAVSQLLNGDGPIGVAVLIAWAVMLVSAEAMMARPIGAELTTTAATNGRLAPIPAWVTAIAVSARVHGALLHAELLKMLRWRRVLVSIAVGAAFIALAIRVSLRSPYLMADVAVTLAPFVIVGSLLANLFAVDGAGAQLYYIAPIAPVKAWRAKVASTAIIALGLELGGWGALLALGNVPTLAGALFLACSAVAFFAWCAAIGGLLSVLFPRATDTRQFGRGLIAPEAALLWIPAVGIIALIAVGGAFLYDFGRLPGGGLVMTGAAIAGFSLFMLRTVDRILRTLLQTRVERLTAVLAGQH